MTQAAEVLSCSLTDHLATKVMLWHRDPEEWDRSWRTSRGFYAASQDEWRPDADIGDAFQCLEKARQDPAVCRRLCDELGRDILTRLTPLLLSEIVGRATGWHPPKDVRPAVEKTKGESHVEDSIKVSSEKS